jgi:tRNA pseudouridine38/39 synthase
LDGGDAVARLAAFGPGAGTPVDWEGCGYSKCGRTDRGVSAFGQVVGIRVRSALGRGKVVDVDGDGELMEMDGGEDGVTAAKLLVQEKGETSEELDDTIDPVENELPYIALLNKVLPPTIRVLAWCPSLPDNFSARFSCKEREYRYFFTTPAYLPVPSSSDATASGNASSCWLDIPAMQEAASYLVGSHDFRNLCKVDASKQITNFVRSIRHASIDLVTTLPNPASPSAISGGQPEMGLYTFTVRGSAFLWHQVRCMVGILFLVGQGLEKPTVVKELLDIEKCAGRPKYEMASDRPLVLWDCKFSASHGTTEDGASSDQRHWDRGAGEDELEWAYAGEDIPKGSAVAPGIWGRNGLMEDLWKNWRATKMEEILTAQLMNVVASQMSSVPASSRDLGHTTKIFAGDDFAPNKGKYIPIMQMHRMESVEIINARYAERKGIQGRAPRDDDANE